MLIEKIIRYYYLFIFSFYDKHLIVEENRK